MTTLEYDRLDRAGQRAAIPAWQRDLLWDGLDAINATPAMCDLLFKAYRAAGFKHALDLLQGWSA